MAFGNPVNHFFLDPFRSNSGVSAWYHEGTGIIVQEEGSKPVLDVKKVWPNFSGSVICKVDKRESSKELGKCDLCGQNRHANMLEAKRFTPDIFWVGHALYVEERSDGTRRRRFHWDCMKYAINILEDYHNFLNDPQNFPQGQAQLTELGLAEKDLIDLLDDENLAHILHKQNRKKNRDQQVEGDMVPVLQGGPGAGVR